jgi:hypothetical protein
MTKPNNFQTREEWLNFVMDEVRPVFVNLNAPLPAKIRLSVGFTSNGYRGKAIGECWDSKASGDKNFEIFVKPDQDEAVRVAGILVHELVHAAVGIDAGHKAPFKRVAVQLGLEGKMTATTEGDAFIQMITPILKNAGPLPHKRLQAYRTKKKQGTRLLKCECECCGYTVRVAKKWILEGAPHCGTVSHGRMICDELPDDEGDDE